MPAPQAVLCHLCGGKYFKHSLPIHLKQCEKKYIQTHSRCEYCGSAVANSDWSDHRQHCKPPRGSKKRRIKKFTSAVELPKSVDNQLIPTVSNKSKIKECQECETENAVWKCVQCEQLLCIMCETELHRKGARARHERIPISVNAFKKSNMKHDNNVNSNNSNNIDITENDEDDLEHEMKDPRRQCKFCSRKFNPDRIEKHMRICNNHTKKSKRRKVWNGSERRVDGTVFEEFKYCRSRTPPQVKEWRKNGRRWRKEREQFREIIDIGKEIKINSDEKKEEKEKESSINPNHNNNDIPIQISAPKNRPNFSIQGTSAVSSRSRSRTNSAKQDRSESSISGINNNSRSKKTFNQNNRYNRSTNNTYNRNRTNSTNKNNNNNNNNSSNSRINSRVNSKVNSKVNSRRTSYNSSLRSSISNSKRSSISDKSQSQIRRNSNSKQTNQNNSNNSNNNNSNVNISRKPRIPKARTYGTNNSNRSSKIRFNKNNDINNVTSKIDKISISDENSSSNGISIGNTGTMSKSPSVPAAIINENKDNADDNNIKPIKQKIPNKNNTKLSRGAELGMNVKNYFDNKPKNMQDYRERERIRREKARQTRKSTGIGNNSSSASSSSGIGSTNSNTSIGNGTQLRQKRHSTRKAAKELSYGPGGKRMPRVEIQKQTNFQSKKIGGKPKNSKDLSEQRAAYFESLLQHDN